LPTERFLENYRPDLGLLLCRDLRAMPRRFLLPDGLLQPGFHAFVKHLSRTTTATALLWRRDELP
jgi:hypothetical protein